MSENRKKILELLAKGKINADEAYKLLGAIDSEEEPRENAPREEAGGKEKPRYLRVNVFPDPDNPNTGRVDRVNVRVPMSLIRAGIKLGSLIPPEAMEKVNGAMKDKGIDFDFRSVKSEDIENLVDALADLEVDVVTAQGEKVKVFTE